MAKSEAGFARTTITVPSNIKARMDAIGASENWSAIASKAFEHRLLELESTRMTDTIDEVAQRLKASLELEEKEDYQAGLAAGTKWASRHAKAIHLKRLAQAIDESGFSVKEQAGVCLNGSNNGVGAWLIAVIGPNKERDRKEVDYLISTMIDVDRTETAAEQMENEQFATGFITGALDIWEQAQSRM
jgi:hypothetical protein